MSAVGEPSPAESGETGRVRAAAASWQRVQLAVLGFIGLCGVLTTPEPDTPRGIQIAAGVLALAALAVACLATLLVARVAWPLRASSSAGEDDPRTLDALRRSVSLGLALTFLAVALVALSASAGWWPVEEEPGGAAEAAALVEARAGGRWLCGTLAEAGAGIVRLERDGGTLDVPLSSVSALRPAASCP